MMATLCRVPFLFLLAGCGGGDAQHPSGTHVHADGTVHRDDHAPQTGDHPHGERQALGQAVLGAHTLAVFQEGALVPGKEAHIDLDVAAGQALPEVVRGWVGVESGQGSRKARFDKESATNLHGHLEVPDPLPAGSALWLEIDGAAGPVRASVAFRP